MISYIDSAATITPDNLKGFFVGWSDPPSPETHLKMLRGSDDVVLAMDGETREEAERNTREAIQFHVEGLRKDNLQLPESHSSASHIAVP